MEGGGAGWPEMRRCGGVKQDESLIMNQTMLRFRPIAPKPVANSDGGTEGGNKHSILTAGRTKRKYVRVCKNVGYSRKNKETTRGAEEANKAKAAAADTLQLLSAESGSDHPLSEDGCRFDLNCAFGQNAISPDSNLPVHHDQVHHLGSRVHVPKWLRNYVGDGGGSDPTVGMQQQQEKMTKAESWVTVECVTGSCMGAQGAFWVCTDAERMMSLEEDTCPGFTSDGENRVQWLNGAFKRMVSQHSYTSDIAVWLVVKEQLPYEYAALTCQVKLQYMVGKDRCFRIVPCDLWRMDGGGFAWRLDVEAALSLGR